MHTAGSTLQGRGDLMLVRAERTALAVDAMVSLAGEGTPARPITMWFVRPVDDRLAVLAEKSLQGWVDGTDAVDLKLELEAKKPRARISTDDTRITFELLACAGLPEAR